MSERIDIEAALHWAFGVVQVDRLAPRLGRYGRDSLAILAEIGLPRGPSFRSASDMMSSVASLGVVVRGGGVVAGHVPLTGGSAVRGQYGAAETDEDALEILDAVTDLPSVFIQIAEEGVILWDRQAMDDAGLEVVGGCGSPFLRGANEEVPVEDANVLAAIVGNARLGTAMAWNTVTVDEEPRRRGRPSAEEVERSRLQWQRLVMVRARYSAWHMSLRWLASRLSGRLVTMEVGGPSTPATPWHVAPLPTVDRPIEPKSAGAKALKRRGKNLA